MAKQTLKQKAVSAGGNYLLTKVGGKQAQKLFTENLSSYTPKDPLYEEETDHKGRVKRVRRKLPAGLSKRDLKILKKVLKRAHHMDKGFNILGFKVGWSFFVNLVPVAGDITGLLLNQILIVRPSQKCDLPPWLLARMTANNMVSFGIGMVPFAGDVGGAVFKTNSRNALLLEEFLTIRGQEYLESQAMLHSGGANKPDHGVVKPGAGAVPGEQIEREPRSWWGGKKGRHATKGTAAEARMEDGRGAGGSGGRGVEMSSVPGAAGSNVAGAQVKR